MHSIECGDWGNVGIHRTCPVGGLQTTQLRQQFQRLAHGNSRTVFEASNRPVFHCLYSEGRSYLQILSPPTLYTRQGRKNHRQRVLHCIQELKDVS